MEKKILPIDFPQDELGHQVIVEWWYLNGHLWDDNGNHYTLMTCFFKADPNLVKIPFLSKIPLNTIYFIHTVMADLKNNRVSSEIKPINIASQNRLVKDLLYLKIGNYILEEKKLFKYSLASDHFFLNLISNKKPLLENTTGYINLKVKDTYYYSLTDITASGHLKIGGNLIKVKGKMWLDHQWANCGWQPDDDKWVWFSIQLENNIEIVCFEYGGKIKTKLATIIYPDSRQKNTSIINFTSINIDWVSPKTGANYKLGWRIDIPEFDISLKVKPLLESQEMLFGVINYWEGGIKVEAKIKNQKVGGWGFLEIAGTPMPKNVGRILEKEIRQKIKSLLKQFLVKYF